MPADHQGWTSLNSLVFTRLVVSKHLQTDEEGLTETVLAEKAKTGQSATSAAQEPSTERSLPLLHCVV